MTDGFLNDPPRSVKWPRDFHLWKDDDPDSLFEVSKHFWTKAMDKRNVDAERVERMMRNSPEERSLAHGKD